MEEKLISSLNIQKLGHDLLEIRQRALYNIVSKLNRGFVFDNNLARSKEILRKLLDWFLYDPSTNEETVFELMKRILMSESGSVLIRHYGPSEIRKEVETLRSYTEPKFHGYVDDLLKIISEQATKSGSCKPNITVPPLESELPLSYRTGHSETSSRTVDSVYYGTTATPIEGFVEHVPSLSQRAGREAGASLYSARDAHNARGETTEDVSGTNQFPSNGLQVVTLNWQYLMEADRHVLQSVETALKNPQQPTALLDSCEFFKDVLLHDFPAEVFIQRPSIVIYFQNFLLTCPSTRITNSILECLLELTTALQIRIKHLYDPSIYNTKAISLSGTSSCLNSPVSKSPEDSSLSKSSARQEPEQIEDVALLKNKQMTAVQFALGTTKYVFKYLYAKPGGLTDSSRRNVSQNGINIALSLLHELLNLLKLCMNTTIWEFKQNPDTRELIKQFTETLVEHGDLLDYFRIESSSNDSDLNYRAIYLYLCCYTSTLLSCTIPVAKCVIILPKNFKTVLSHCIIDVTLARLYPRTHKVLLEYAQNCCVGETHHLLRKFKQVDDICQSMSAASNLLKNYKSLKTSQTLCLSKQSLQCLEFHKDLKVLKIFVDDCANKLPLYSDNDDMWKLAEDVTLCLLSHSLREVSEEMYRLCQRKVIGAIGPKLNLSGSGAPGSQVLFLLRPKILTEISLFGITSENIQVQKFSEDILVHILKCKILVSDEIWDEVIEALLLSMPVILCHCNKNSCLGRTLVDLLDPDTAQSNMLPSLTILKGNIELLYSKDISIREEAFSRLCWLLSSQEASRDFLPRLNNLNDRALSNVCQLTKVLDVNRSRNMQHFYQPSNLEQVLDVLKSPNVEPVIRRSALTQISVMMEDPLLHQTFLENNCIGIIIDIMKSALLDRDFKDYPDSVIPAISILKNLCFYHSSSRHELSFKEDVLFCILRGLYMFFTEERLRQDASTLLFILTFNDFCMGTPSTGSFSLPKLVTENLNVPFKCHQHWTHSQYKEESLIPSITSDKWCLSAIQIHWNLEMGQGFKELLKFESNLSHDATNNGALLQLSENDLKALKASSLDYCIEHYLIDIQNATTHHNVTDAVQKLSIYVHLYNILKVNEKVDGICNYSWELSFSRFFKLLPSSEDDLKILTTVIDFLILLANSYSTIDESCWVNTVLKDPCLCLLDIIHVDASTSEASKSLSRKLLKLITVCVCKEQHYLEYFPNAPNENETNHQWFTVIKNIAESLKFNDTQHFYNLAYLDSLLSCLVHLTAMLGWSASRQDGGPKHQIKQMISGLCELVNAFHYGKGSTAAVSVMGLSITRNSLLILNHLLAELQCFSVKGWEHCFLPELNEVSVLQSLISLVSSRDVVLRAAAMQLFAGVIISPRLAVHVVGEIIINKHSVWELAFSILADQDEASIVKENAAIFLANLSSHTTRGSSDKNILITGVDPSKLKKDHISGSSLWDYVEDYQLFGNLELILTCLFTSDKNWQSPNNKNGLRRYSNSEKSWSSSSSSKIAMISTPALVKSTVILLSHIFVLDYDRVAYNLSENGLVKLLMKCLCSPNLTVENTKDLSLYCDIMEMNSALCGFLAQIVVRSSTCLGTVLHTRDCLNVMVSLLNPKIFYIHLPQLVYLRNKLWSEIFHLIGTLIESGTDNEGRLSQHSIEALNIFLDVLFETGKEAFLETLCEAIGSTGSNELQTSALSSLTSLLKVESNTKLDEYEHEKLALERASMQSLLDNVKTPRTTCSDQFIDENEENVKPNIPAKKNLTRKSLKHLHKINLLEDAYFGQILKKKVHKLVMEKRDVEFAKESDMLMAGAEICKILLNLFDLCNINMTNNMYGRKRNSVIAALTNVLSISQEAKNYALDNGLLHLIIEQLKEYHIKFSLESAECLRRVADRKRLFPMLRELIDLIGLLTNFMIHDENVKCEASYVGLADLVHKLWVWFSAQRIYLVDALRLLSTYTADCETACHSLLLTSAVAGTGPRKTPTNLSLLHVIINLVIKEMDQISKAHELTVLQLCFSVLHNCCAVQECRLVLMKSAILQSLARLHPAITKKQRPWDSVERLWLDFLQTYTFHPEGQTSVAKIPDAMEVIMSLATNGKEENKYSALLVLRNIAFHQPNRPRLLMSGDFLNILQTKLINGTVDEKNTVVLIMWALAENNQKAKLVLKSAKLDVKLQDSLKQLHLFSNGSVNVAVIERMNYVLSILKDGDKSR